MGQSQSYQVDDNNGVKYTDAEIKANIAKLFNNNKFNDLSEHTFSDLGKLVISEQPPVMNGGSSGSGINRYSKYESQIGGDDKQISKEFAPLSDMSEFEKIKVYLMQNNSLPQSTIPSNNSIVGGSKEDKDILSDFDKLGETPKTENIKNKITFFDILNGGKAMATKNKDDVDLNFEEDTNDDDNDNDNDNDDDDDDDKINENNKKKSEKENKNKNTKNNIKKVDDDDDDDDEEDEDEDNKDDDEDTENNKDVNTNQEKFSDTSYTTVNTDELNIIPFYSSSDSNEINQHPYVRNRFNK